MTSVGTENSFVAQMDENHKPRNKPVTAIYGK